MAYLQNMAQTHEIEKKQLKAKESTKKVEEIHTFEELKRKNREEFETRKAALKVEKDMQNKMK